MSKRSWELQPGDKAFGSLVVVAPLGGGRRTEVYRVRDSRTDERGALKVVRPNALGSSARRSVEREAATLSLLDHPGIPRLLDARPDAPASWLIMQEYRAPSVRDLIRMSGPLSLKKTIRMLIDVSSAVDHMHEAGFIHMDLKPGNMNSGKTYSVLDLGGAMSYESAGLLKRPHGTWSYLAPEQVHPGKLGKPGLTTDTWGLAISAVVAHTGMNPVKRDREDTTPRHEERVARWVRRRTRSLPEPLDEILYDCFATDPDDRPTMAELRALLV